MFKRYMDYVKDNPKGYWFKAKWFGWGWTPVTWQGWAVTLAYVLLIVAFAFTIDENSSAREIAFTFIIPSAILTATLIRICYAKGEKPSWRWGMPEEK